MSNMTCQEGAANRESKCMSLSECERERTRERGRGVRVAKLCVCVCVCEQLRYAASQICGSGGLAAAVRLS